MGRKISQGHKYLIFPASGKGAVLDGKPLSHHTTICSSAPSELLVALALRHRGTLIERNLAIVRHGR